MKTPALVGLICASIALGCGSSEDSAPTAVTVEFAAAVDGEPFVCGETYDNLGSDGASFALTDFRFYVQDIELRAASGEYVPLELEENEWQVGQTVLIDFEDDCGTELGNEAMNALAAGTAEGGPFTGIRFQMGVPFTENHSNLATAPSPLNLPPMHWNWQGGYKFLRIDSGSFEATSWRMHLGSTGCDGDPVSGGTTSCANSNRVNVELDFDPSSEVVVADFARLVDGAPLGTNQPETPVGCMAGPGDSDCGPLFDNLGLAFGGEEPPGDQIFFSAETP